MRSNRNRRKRSDLNKLNSNKINMPPPHFEENSDEARKHKCKSTGFEDLNFPQGLVLLLLLKKIGFLDDGFMDQTFDGPCEKNVSKEETDQFDSDFSKTDKFDPDFLHEDTEE